MIRLPVTPVPKPRMVRADKWKRRPAVLRYREFADRLRAELAAAGVADVAPEGRLRATFVLPMPKSWSKRKRAELAGRPHTSKPDVDNLAKALLDAAKPEGDAHVWSIAAMKVWGEEGSIILWTGRG
ncbi:MAG TPA: RusA family crossover junction endodeoxyribonuclease [Longimicrobiales bacterium]